MIRILSQFEKCDSLRLRAEVISERCSRSNEVCGSSLELASMLILVESPKSLACISMLTLVYLESSRFSIYGSLIVDTTELLIEGLDGTSLRLIELMFDSPLTLIMAILLFLTMCLFLIVVFLCS